MKEENCPICNNKKKLVKNCKSIFQKTCGNPECIKENRKRTNLIKYGHICNIHSKETNEKIRKNLNDVYGVDNVSQIDAIKLKKKNTCRKNFGVDHPMQSNIVMDKSINTSKEKYGYDRASKHPDIIDKIKQTNLKIDESTGLTIRELSRIKCKSTIKNKYGVEYYFQTKEFFKSQLDNGRILDSKTLNEWQIYKKQVISLTIKNVRKYINLIHSTIKNNIDTKYHIDHIYSVSKGFENNIPIDIISSPVNLQLIEATINIKKQAECWITKKELYKRYTLFEQYRILLFELFFNYGLCPNI